MSGGVAPVPARFLDRPPTTPRGPKTTTKSQTGSTNTTEINAGKSTVGGHVAFNLTYGWSFSRCSTATSLLVLSGIVQLAKANNDVKFYDEYQPYQELVRPI